MWKPASKPRVLVVDGEPLVLETWKEALSGRYEVVLFSDPAAARSYVEANDVAVALLEVRLCGLDGLALLAELKRLRSDVAVIMVSGRATIHSAAQALQAGAYDWVSNPLDDLGVVVRRVDAAVEHLQLRDLSAALQARLAALGPSTTIVGDSQALQRVRELVAQLADSSAPVLLRGERGTGKELTARALHAQGNRRDRPFIAVSCATMAASLIESELFGHERDAFAGAVTRHDGLLAAADGGVLFLDEICDVPLESQVRLLRAMQAGEVRPVGSTMSQRLDVRVFISTSTDLERALRSGGLSADLYDHVRTFCLDLPPLRERREDIPPIARHLLDLAARGAGRSAPDFTEEALATLVGHAWPGNVGELGDAVEHGLRSCSGERLDVRHLPAAVSTRSDTAARAPGPTERAADAPFSVVRQSLVEQFEVRYLTDLMVATDGNLSAAARLSGIDRSNLRRLLRRYSINVNGFRSVA